MFFRGPGIYYIHWGSKGLDVTTDMGTCLVLEVSLGTTSKSIREIVAHALTLDTGCYDIFGIWANHCQDFTVQVGLLLTFREFRP